MSDLIQKITKAKQAGAWLKWQHTCLATASPQVQIPVQQ
jgi:hypothetical protein